MPTTPNGTAYTTFSATVAGADTVRWAVADETAEDSNIPVVLYAHGSGGASNQFETLAAWAGLRNWLIDNGWAWIEGLGGGNKSWGNAAARTAYENSYLHVAGILDLGAVVPLGRSMGGVVASWLYTESTVIEPVSVGCIINSGVQSLAAWYEAGIDQAAVMAAFNADNESEFYSNIAGFDPLTRPASLWDGKNVIQLVGTADTTVPPGDHGYAMRAHYSGRPTIDDLDVRVGGDHSATNGSYLETDAMTTFLMEVTGTTPPPPGPRLFYRNVARYWIDNDLNRRAIQVVV